MSALPPHANLTPEEVRKFLRISKTLIYQLIADGDLPSIKVRRVIRIPRDKFLEWYKKNTRG